jgi:hypothetical protein
MPTEFAVILYVGCERRSFEARTAGIMKPFTEGEVSREDRHLGRMSRRWSIWDTVSLRSLGDTQVLSGSWIEASGALEEA